MRLRWEVRGHHQEVGVLSGQPQLTSGRQDLFKCSSFNSDVLLLDSAQCTAADVKALGQEASPSKCVLLSTSDGAMLMLDFLGLSSLMCATGNVTWM